MYYLNVLSEFRKLKAFYPEPGEALQYLRRFIDYSTSSKIRSGQINHPERERLVQWVVGHASTPGPIVEIGTLFGFSTQALCEAVLSSGVRKTVFTVDNYSWNPMGLPPDRHRLLTRFNLEFASRITDLFIVDSSAEAFYGTFDQVPSFVFIDADHRYEHVRKDLLFFKSIGTKAIAGHDYNFPGVRRAVDEVFGEGGVDVFEGTMFLYSDQ